MDDGNTKDKEIGIGVGVPIREVAQKDIMMVETYLTEKVTYKDGTHEHRVHLHTQHAVALFFKVQLPNELIPRNIQLNLCPLCGLAWWVETRLK